MAKSVLVTGANKGIGLAIARRILLDIEGSFVYLGSRSSSNGQSAVKKLVDENKGFGERVRVVEIDVSSDESVKAAAKLVDKDLRENENRAPLFAIVNNAGTASDDIEMTLNVNVYGPKRVIDNFLPLLDQTNGRVVNIGSGSAPQFVTKCKPDSETRKLLTHKVPNESFKDLDNLVKQFVSASKSKESWTKFTESELDEEPKNGGYVAYGFSKAVITAYTLVLAEEHKNLRINVVSPGFIGTDLVFEGGFVNVDRNNAEQVKKAGLKTPDEGTKSTMVLLTGENETSKFKSGHYFGSDGKRSPIDTYRSPGTPEFTGAY